MSETPVEYRGYNGSIQVWPDRLVITHHGLAATIGAQRTNQPRTIPLREICGVTLKDANWATNGWITIGQGGAPAPMLRPSRAPSDPQTVMFRRKDRDAFGQLHTWLRTVAERNAAQGFTSSEVASALAGAEPGASTQGAVPAPPGTKAMAAGAPGAGKEAKPAPKRTAIGCGILVVLAIVIVGCVAALGGGDNDDNQADDSTPTATATRTPTPSPTPPTTGPPLARIKGAVASTDTQSPTVTAMGDGQFHVTFKVKENLTKGLMRTGLVSDVFDMLEAINATGAQFRQIWFIGTFPLTDAYGNTEDGAVFRASFTADTVHRIRYDTVIRNIDTLRQLAEPPGVMLHPDFN